MHSPDGKKRGGADAASFGGPLVMQVRGLMNFDKDYKEFIEWEKTQGGSSGPTEFTAEEDVSIRLFVAYLNCRYAPPSPNQSLDSDSESDAIWE